MNLSRIRGSVAGLTWVWSEAPKVLTVTLASLLALRLLVITPFLKLSRRPRHPIPVQPVASLIVQDPLIRFLTHDALHSLVANTIACGTPAAIMLLRFDNLDTVTIRHGPRVAELALIAASERLGLLWPGQLWARMVGDVFGIAIAGLSGEDEIENAALAVIRSVEQPMMLLGTQLDLVTSVGIALIPEHVETAEIALRMACSAMSRASAAGGSQWRIFSPEQERVDALRTSIKEELASAIAAGEIIPFYQSIVDLRTGRIAGLEVLARWHHKSRGVLSPDVFIPLAEEMHLTGYLTQTLMRRVLADSRFWPEDIYFAFNVSPGQLRELIGLIRDPPAWPEGTIDPTRIEIEITENALIEDLTTARAVIEILQLKGTKVVLDDFGVGYSNFFHLRELPFDKIKIDKSFVLDLGFDPRAEACVRTMLALGASLGIEMVAEGIERTANAEHLTRLGCRFGQGFLYSAPVCAADVPSLLAASALV